MKNGNDKHHVVRPNMVKCKSDEIRIRDKIVNCSKLISQALDMEEVFRNRLGPFFFNRKKETSTE